MGQTERFAESIISILNNSFFSILRANEVNFAESIISIIKILNNSFFSILRANEVNLNLLWHVGTLLDHSLLVRHAMVASPTMLYPSSHSNCTTVPISVSETSLCNGEDTVRVLQDNTVNKKSIHDNCSVINTRYSLYVRRHRLPQFSWYVMGKIRQLCHRPNRINTQAVRFYTENNSMREFMWSIERDMIRLLVCIVC